MKVFNWVQRRLLNVHSCTNFPQENGELEDGGHDAHMVVNMLDHWNDGILSIGTLAIGPLENCDEYDIIEEVNDGHDKAITNYVHDQDVMDDHDIKDDNHDNDNDDDDDEMNPLMKVDIFSHELEKFIGANHEITEEEVVEHEGQTNKRRVTLADLFLEDPDHYHPLQVLKELDNEDHDHDDDDYDDDDNDHDHVKDDVVVEKKGLKMIIKPTSRVKNRLSKAKKLVMEELHPLKKFNKIVKRIMKKKIYPDLEGKTKDNQMQQSYNSTNEQDVANHSASLLLVQGNMV